MMGLFLHLTSQIRSGSWSNAFLQTRGSGSSCWAEPWFSCALERCSPQRHSLCVCVCVCSLHFPVEVTALVTKLSNSGLPVLGQELGFQSHLQWCGGARGHDGGLWLFMHVLWMSLCA